jgi:hypothetical protein
MDAKLPEFPYERQAMAGEEMPDGLNMPDTLMYIGLRMLYNQYKSGTIGRDLATAEKRKLIKKYKYQMFLQEASERYVKNIKQTELARAEYRKERTLEAADKLVLALEGKILCQSEKTQTED